ncbi:MAG: sigma-54 dependent transcriptional regulator [Devosia sp.]
MGGLIVVIEDEPLLGRNMRVYLERQGFTVRHVTTLKEGIAAYREMQPDLVFIDHNLPDGTGLSIVETIRHDDRWTRLVMITAHGGVELAVAAMKAGANDYLTKPVALSELGLLAERLLEQARLENSLSFFAGREKRLGGIDRIVGTSTGAIELKRRIRSITRAETQAAQNGADVGPPVLILGETGTGKELVARALHFDGPRAEQPFISVNCAALPEQLVESELFGHEKGAFTGATEKKIGLFQAAEGGTLFLDEVGELPLAQQGKLLRALEDRVVRPVGSLRDRAINVRFLAATNSAIEDRARQGEFRSDLLYRLNTVTIEVPPLRQRGDDVLRIAEGLAEEFRSRYGRDRLDISPAARQALLRHSWPGNIRELRNTIEQAALLCARDKIEEADLNLRDVPSLAEMPVSRTEDQDKLTEAEKTLIIGALRQNSGNVTLAARSLGISRDTLRYRMEKHALRRDFYTE